jgi:hypothetical protein
MTVHEGFVHPHKHSDAEHLTYRTETKPEGYGSNGFVAYIIQCEWDRQGRLLREVHVLPYHSGSGQTRETARNAANAVILKRYVDPVAWCKDRKHGFMSLGTGRFFGVVWE